MPRGRAAALICDRLRELLRDEAVVVAALRRELAALVDEAAALSPEALRGRARGCVAAARGRRRALGARRVVRRGRPVQGWARARCPPALRGFAHHGRYLGGFAGAEVAARALGGPSGGAAWVEALHRAGVIWTLPHAGALHVFMPGGGGA